MHLPKQKVNILAGNFHKLILLKIALNVVPQIAEKNLHYCALDVERLCKVEAKKGNNHMIFTILNFSNDLLVFL